MKKTSVHIIILVILFFTQSCIKEETPYCPDSALRLSFRYILNNKYTDLFGSEVHQVTAYIFDVNGKYINSYSESTDKLANKYILDIPLPEGYYQAVVFCDNLKTFSAGRIDSQTNSFHKELVPGVTGIEDFSVMLNNIEGSDGYLVPESVPGDLYAGYAIHALSSYDASHITNIDLMKDTKNIKVKISGLNLLTRSSVVPEVYITARNGRYKRDNSVDTSLRSMKYKPYKTSIMGNTMEIDLKTMRLVIGHAPMLVIKLPGSPEYILNRDITELILSNPKYVSQEDIDREDTFVFEVYLSQSGNDIIISVSINGWKINTVIPEND